MRVGGSFQRATRLIQIGGIVHSHNDFDATMWMEADVFDRATRDGAVGNDDATIVWCVQRCCEQVDLVDFAHDAARIDHVAHFEGTDDQNKYTLGKVAECPLDSLTDGEASGRKQGRKATQWRTQL